MRADAHSLTAHFVPPAAGGHQVRALLRLGAAPDSPRPPAGPYASCTPYDVALPACKRAFEDELRQQCAAGELARVTQLLDAGVPCAPAEPGALGSDAPVLWAAAFGHAPLIAALAVRGGAPAARAARTAEAGASAAHEAARAGHALSCAVLLAAGAVDLQATGSSG
jgi:hypothetical protein